MTTRLTKFLRKSPADRRMLAHAAALYVVTAIVLRVMPFGGVRRVLGHVAAIGSRPRDAGDVEARVVAAVRAVASFLPDGNCLTESLVAQCLLARYHRETTLCFGIARNRPAGRPFDAHAWLERRGARLTGARAIVYDPLRHPSRCVSSPSPR